MAALLAALNSLVGRAWERVSALPQRFSALAARRLLVFTLNSELRPYFASAIHQDQLDTQLSAGRGNVTLCDLHLNPDVLTLRLRGLLRGVAGAGAQHYHQQQFADAVRVAVCHVDQLEIEIPWGADTGGIRIHLSGVTIDLEVIAPGACDSAAQEEAAALAVQSSLNAAMSSSLAREQDRGAGRDGRDDGGGGGGGGDDDEGDDAGGADDYDDDDDDDDVGPSDLQSYFERMLRMVVRVHGLRVVVRFPRDDVPPPARVEALVVSLDAAQYRAEESFSCDGLRVILLLRHSHTPDGPDPPPVLHCPRLSVCLDSAESVGFETSPDALLLRTSQEQVRSALALVALLSEEYGNVGRAARPGQTDAPAASSSFAPLSERAAAAVPHTPASSSASPAEAQHDQRAELISSLHGSICLIAPYAEVDRATSASPAADGDGGCRSSLVYAFAVPEFRWEILQGISGGGGGADSAAAVSLFSVTASGIACNSQSTPAAPSRAQASSRVECTIQRLSVEPASVAAAESALVPPPPPPLLELRSPLWLVLASSSSRAVSASSSSSSSSVAAAAAASVPSGGGRVDQTLHARELRLDVHLDLDSWTRLGSWAAGSFPAAPPSAAGARAGAAAARATKASAPPARGRGAAAPPALPQHVPARRPRPLPVFEFRCPSIDVRLRTPPPQPVVLRLHVAAPRLLHFGPTPTTTTTGARVPDGGAGLGFPDSWRLAFSELELAGAESRLAVWGEAQDPPRVDVLLAPAGGRHAVLFPPQPSAGGADFAPLLAPAGAALAGDRSVWRFFAPGDILPEWGAGFSPGRARASAAVAAEVSLPCVRFEIGDLDSLLRVARALHTESDAPWPAYALALSVWRLGGVVCRQRDRGGRAGASGGVPLAEEADEEAEEEEEEEEEEEGRALGESDADFCLEVPAFRLLQGACRAAAATASGPAATGSTAAAARSRLRAEEEMVLYCLACFESLNLYDDRDHTVLLRSTPPRVYLQEVFCAPLALSLASLHACGPWGLCSLERVTVGCSVGSWSRLRSRLVASAVAAARRVASTTTPARAAPAAAPADTASASASASASAASASDDGDAPVAAAAAGGGGGGGIDEALSDSAGDVCIETIVVEDSEESGEVAGGGGEVEGAVTPPEPPPALFALALRELSLYFQPVGCIAIPPRSLLRLGELVATVSGPAPGGGAGAFSVALRLRALSLHLIQVGAVPLGAWVDLCDGASVFQYPTGPTPPVRVARLPAVDAFIDSSSSSSSSSSSLSSPAAAGGAAAAFTFLFDFSPGGVHAPLEVSLKPDSLATFSEAVRLLGAQLAREFGGDTLPPVAAPAPATPRVRGARASRSPPRRRPVPDGGGGAAAPQSVSSRSPPSDRRRPEQSADAAGRVFAAGASVVPARAAAGAAAAACAAEADSAAAGGGGGGETADVDEFGEFGEFGECLFDEVANASEFMAHGAAEPEGESESSAEEGWHWVRSAEEEAVLTHRRELEVFPPDMPVATDVRVRNLEVSVHLTGGSDWPPPLVDPAAAAPAASLSGGGPGAASATAPEKRHGRASSNRDTVVVAARVCDAGFSLFAPCAASEWRVRVHLDHVRIDDALRRSHLRAFLLFPPRRQGDGRPDVRLLLEQVRVQAAAAAAAAPLHLKMKGEFAPMRFHVDQGALVFLVDFFCASLLAPGAVPASAPAPAPAAAAAAAAAAAGSAGAPPVSSPSPARATAPAPEPAPGAEAAPLSAGTVFEWFELGEITGELNYLPHENTARTMISDVVLGNKVQMLKWLVTLRHAPLDLPAVSFADVPVSELADRLVDVWLPHTLRLVSGTRLAAPVHVALRIVTAIVDLFRIPLQDVREGRRNPLIGAGVGAAHLAQTVAVEAVDAGVGGAVRLNKGVRFVERWLDAPPEGMSAEAQHLSMYAGQPATLLDGASQAAQQLREGLQAWGRVGGEGPTAVPVALLATVGGVLGAIARTFMAVRNVISPQELAEADERYKSAPGGGGGGDDDDRGGAGGDGEPPPGRPFP